MRTSYRALLAIAIGVAAPHAEVAWKCRAGSETTEQCVWGRAYLPMTRWLEPLLIAPVAFVVLTLVTYRRRPPGEA